MRVVITGGAGFIGRAVVQRLTARGDDVVAMVRDPATAQHLVGDRVTLVASDLSDSAQLVPEMRRAGAVIHAAGRYEVGVSDDECWTLFEANYISTERVLRAAVDGHVPRIVYVSTLGVLGNTKGRIVDETYRRKHPVRFLSCYDKTKFGAHEIAELRQALGAPLAIVMPGQVYGPHDHSAASEQLRLAHAGTLTYVAFPKAGLAWVHVDDLADAIVNAVGKARQAPTYSLGGECLRMREAVAIAARVGGHEPPRWGIPTLLLRALAPINDRLAHLPRLPKNLGEVISAGEGVTYWAKHDKATAELGFRPRLLEQGIADTWGTGGG